MLIETYISFPILHIQHISGYNLGNQILDCYKKITIF